MGLRGRDREEEGKQEERMDVTLYRKVEIEHIVTKSFWITYKKVILDPRERRKRRRDGRR